VESGEDLGCLKGGYVNKAAPYIFTKETFGFKARDDAKIVCASF
jgi:hypothetical protein